MTIMNNTAMASTKTTCGGVDDGQGLEGLPKKVQLGFVAPNVFIFLPTTMTTKMFTVTNIPHGSIHRSTQWSSRRSF